jgi:hypothetical protein
MSDNSHCVMTGATIRVKPTEVVDWYYTTFVFLICLPKPSG